MNPNSLAQAPKTVYWSLSTTTTPTPALIGLRWRYTNYCRLVWETVDQAIAQAISELTPELQQCLHSTLTYEERKALKSDVLWLLIEQTGVTVDLELTSTDDLTSQDLTNAVVQLDRFRTVLSTVTAVGCL